MSATQPAKKICSVSDLIVEVERIQRSTPSRLRFRGQRKASWDLVPHAFRGDHERHERNYRHRFRSTAVLGAKFVREKAKWFVDPPLSARFLDNFVSRECVIADASADPSRMLEPFYSAGFDSCALNYADEPRART
jgi:hypothetical protein